MSHISYPLQRKLILISFLLIPLALLAIFTYYPAMRLVYLSFTSWDGISPVKEWLGLGNYIEIFTNPDLFGVFLHQIPYVLIGIIQNIVAIVFAVILNSKLRGRNFFRVMLFLPFIMNAVAVAFMFQYVFDTTNGSLNGLLGLVGLESWQQSWLGNASLVNYALASIGFWRFMGYNMVIYLGALQSIPGDMYEAARIDGASRFQMLWSLTIPNLTPIISLNMFLTLSGALAVFDLPFVLTKGGPAGASETFLFKTIETAFQFNNYGLASAMSVVLLLFTAIILVVQNLVINRKGD
ncbi:raffinose/stachyose/melibiose transport system permease protein [Paenibacillus sp. SORGH_AS306]|uniref:carbohydrate ABC transporter permease n=1 Tax=unclassified Paenibacillus TaxID=185978 RepID=UPI0023651225|nr:MULTISPECIES: sugar ABC transporter permease [unclassified Paenibacillus]MDQ1234977.1 raffinose/stachyose/melibiose transport system permease protein [Paenibacillus sp. SORGH_AS_0306]MDR6112026.1 raffinose/stachyose/melibiose transport system permease protein [Paenibacillus sp. SORGH_AS_0338]WDF52302.1 sugar ABC transporter permease [Paenibacillus sp. KACC 21273]